MSNSLANDFARILVETSREVTDKAITFPVFGDVLGNLDLQIDGFGVSIPAADYHKLKDITVSPGDRVLCIPVEDGHTFVLVGQVE